MEDKSIRENRVFSVELKSMRSLRRVNLANGPNDSVLVEGTIGELVQATFAEGIMLEAIGKEGILRMDLREDEIRKQLKNK